MDTVHAEIISTKWDDARRSLTVSGRAVGAESCYVQVGFSANHYDYSKDFTVVVNNIPSSATAIYIRAVARDNTNVEIPGTEVYKTIAVLRPILGVAKTCDSSSNIVDIVEKKADCSTTERWKSGPKVVQMEMHDVEYYDGENKYGKTDRVCTGHPISEFPDSPSTRGEFQYWMMVKENDINIPYEWMGVEKPQEEEIENGI